tara:strand:- start:1816 stop:2649 length:834 start_codon:yes stop_codon:yes gene_type:complete
MIGYNALGLFGRLGNQMFQYASLKGIARNRNYEYCFPPLGGAAEWNNVEQYYQEIREGKAGHILLQPFTMESNSQLNLQYIDKSRPVVQEKTFAFDEEIFNTCPDWVDIRGFFQTEKYFKHIRDEIKKDFTFRDEIINPCKEMVSGIDDPISLHIRRTDYITDSNHSTLGVDYYESALSDFDSDAPVLVFSDDPKWCNEQELFSDDRFLIAEGNSGYVDMCLMTLCSGHIIANSSFSWWGAWLSDSKQVIAPSQWFTGSNNDSKDTKDIYCEGWKVI